MIKSNTESSQAISNVLIFHPWVPIPIHRQQHLMQVDTDVPMENVEPSLPPAARDDQKLAKLVDAATGELSRKDTSQLQDGTEWY